METGKSILAKYMRCMILTDLAYLGHPLCWLSVGTYERLTDAG